MFLQTLSTLSNCCISTSEHLFLSPLACFSLGTVDEVTRMVRREYGWVMKLCYLIWVGYEMNIPNL